MVKIYLLAIYVFYKNDKKLAIYWDVLSYPPLEIEWLSFPRGHVWLTNQTTEQRYQIKIEHGDHYGAQSYWVTSEKIAVLFFRSSLASIDFFCYRALFGI